MQWPEAFFFTAVTIALPLSIWAYCKYTYLNDKNYRESLIRTAELEIEAERAKHGK